MVKKAPSFGLPRKFDPKRLSRQDYEQETQSPLPAWVRCKICGKGPDGLNWLKPVNPDPLCRVLIHLGCIGKD